jgi:hypothetical protein
MHGTWHRVRRVKCDETKPTCQRCAKLDVVCDGYPETRPIPTAKRIVLKALHPTPPYLVTHIRTGPRFAEEEEGRYFRYYCEETAAQICGPLKSSLWERLIPQAGEIEPYIGHAIVALGALSKACKTLGYDRGLERAAPSNPHHLYALTHYCKALKGMRNAPQSDIYDSRKVLMACLLVFCFEGLQGHHLSASLHALGGLDLLYKFKAAQKRSKGSFAFDCLGRGAIEDDLYAAISGLDLQVLIFLDNRPASRHREIKSDMSSAINSMPSELSSLKQCRDIWQLLMRRNFHFVAEAHAAMKVTAPCLDVVPTEDEGFEDLHALKNSWTGPKRRLENVMSLLLPERDSYMEDIRRWERASASLFQRHLDPENKGREEFFLASMLKLNAAFSMLHLAMTLSPPETSYDAYLPEFQTVTEIATDIHPLLVSSSSSEGATFRFDLGILPALTHVANKCRARAVRTQAINLLEASPGYQEGIWHSDAVLAIARFVRDLEEKWMDGSGSIPGNRRVSMTGANILFHQKKVQIFFTQRTGWGLGDFESLEKTLAW